MFLVLLLYSAGATAQHKPFKLLVQELKDLCFIYDTLDPFSGTVALKEYGVTYQVLLKEHPEPDEITLVHKDSIDVFDLQYYYQFKIRKKFNEVMSHPEVMKHDLAKMFPYVLVSDDKKLYSLSIDERTGGSYHSRFTMYHYTGMVKNEEAAFEGFAQDGYNEVYTLKTKQGSKYLLIGSVVTCNSCMATYALLTHFDKGGFVTDFETMIDGRMGSEITFDPLSKVLSVDYMTDDLLRECFCETLTTEESSNSDEEITEISEEIIIQSCSCKYKFHGNTFKLTTHHFDMAKE